MSQRVSVLISVVAVVLLAVPSALGATRRAADYPQIFVTFNSGSTLTVTLGDGTPLGTSGGAPTVIAPGTYNFSLTDPTYVSDVQFDLVGPGVKLVSNMSYGEEPSETWVETFAPGSIYTWRDDMRPSTVWTFVTSNSASVGSANSGSAGAGSSTTPISSGKTGKASSTDVVGSGIKPAAPLRGTLLGAVSSAGKATLTFGGKPVTSLKAGRYKITVTDKSKLAGFNLQEIRNTATTITPTAFTGEHTTTVTLKAGQWFYYPTFVGKKTYFIVVT
jgi:hypothetical protein